MTQKELLYFEDAINHETSVIKIIEDILLKLRSNDIIVFMNNELKIHKKIKRDLMKVLEVEYHE